MYQHQKEQLWLLSRKKKNNIKSRAWLTFRDIKLSYPSVFFPLWFPQDFHFQRYYTTCFQRNSIFSFRKVISQESNTEWCPGYSFSEPILQSQFVLHDAGATWKGADAVSLGFWGPLLPSQSPPAGHPISIWKELSGSETKQAAWLTQRHPKTLIPSPGLDFGFIPSALWEKSYLHNHHSHPVSFLHVVTEIRGEGSQPKVKDEEMSDFLGYFCADKS